MKIFDSQKIKALRIQRGISQKELAQSVCVSYQTVSRWESGKAQPSEEHIDAMARVLNAETDDFYHLELDQHEEIKGMESVREIYKIGRGPSSSHTMGPERACRMFIEKNPDIDAMKVILYGSLAKTGKGHGTDSVLVKTASPIPCDVVFDFTTTDIPHPNTLDLFGFKDGVEIARLRVMSVGGGSIAYEGKAEEKKKKIYTHHTFGEIAAYCKEKEIHLWQYVLEREDEGFIEYMEQVWDVMKQAILRGIKDHGVLPGGLSVKKRARELYSHQHIDESAQTRENRLVSAYAFAVGEQNASGEMIVTAPTCGAAGVLPAVLYYQQRKNKYTDRQVVNALIVAGLIGNLIKTNASISGAECGCQAEVGSACAMASAALGELFKLDIDKIEYAAEIAIEHHLGLTCDPICGLVQIPCIERNAVAAMRAINAISLASFLWDSRKISLDDVIRTMKETGRDLSQSYKETSEAGLAKLVIE